jgi:hypothetical protein
MSKKIIPYNNFIGEEIEVGFNKLPLFSKEPSCPDTLIWREKLFNISELLNTWRDFQRHGRMEHNMQPDHDARARLKGS